MDLLQSSFVFHLAQQHTSLKTLSISTQSFCDNARSALTKGLEKNTSLSSLIFDCHENDDLIAVCQGLQRRDRTVKELTLICVRFAEPGLLEIARLLESNPYLTKLHMLFWCRAPFPEASDFDIILNGLCRNYSLFEVVLTCYATNGDQAQVKALNDSLLAKVKPLTERNRVRYDQWRQSVMAWMCAAKYLLIPRDVARMIGKRIWDARTEYREEEHEETLVRKRIKEESREAREL